LPYSFRIIVVQSETFCGENSEENDGDRNTGTIKASPNLSSLQQISSQENQSQSDGDKEVNLYILAGHENMQL